jgi:zinc protease
MNTLQRTQPPIFPFAATTSIPVKKIQLRNGISVFLIDAGTEDVMRIEFVFRSGIVKEDIPLLSTTTNIMLTEGSENYTSEELNRLLDFYGVFLNPGVEKDTAGLIAYFLKRHIEKVLGLIREILFRSTFPEKELDLLMKKRLRWFMVNREKVQNLAMDAFFESIFGNHHPYGHQVQEKDFYYMNPSVLKDFHSKFYAPEKMTIIVSGSIHEKTLALLEKYFGELYSKKVYIEEPGNVIKGAAGKKLHIEKPGAVQSAVRIGSSTINKRHPDYPGLKFLNTLLGGYFGSRLMKNIRENKGYTYGVHSSVSSLDLSGYKVISTDVDKNKRVQAVEEIYSEISKLQTIPVEKEEMEVVRKYMSGELVRMFDGPFAMAESFKAVWEFGLDSNYFSRLAEVIKTISPDEIIRLAGTYYNMEDLYEVTAG